MTDQKQPLRISVPIRKFNTELRTVYGFASVSTKNGELVEDAHGDMISSDELVKAAHDFVRFFRTGMEMHNGTMVGEVVECAVFTKDVQEALGIDLGLEGMWIGYRVYDEDVWQKFLSGVYKAFSIGGFATRVQIDG